MILYTFNANLSDDEEGVQAWGVDNTQQNYFHSGAYSKSFYIEFCNIPKNKTMLEKLNVLIW